MRDVDEDAEEVAGVDEVAAGGGQPGAGVGRGREAERHALAERVRPRPDDPDRAQPAVVPGSRSERSGASGSAPSRCMIAFTRPGSSPSTRRTIVTSRPSSTASCPSTSRWASSRGIGSSSGSAYGTCGGRQRRRSGAAGRRRARRSRPRTRPRRAVARSMCAGSSPAPDPQHEVVVPVEDHGRIVRTGW